MPQLIQYLYIAVVLTIPVYLPIIWPIKAVQKGKQYNEMQKQIHKPVTEILEGHEINNDTNLVERYCGE